MQKYGILENEVLRMVSKGTPGAKPIEWAPVPEYDQETEAVFEKTPEDKGDHYYIDLEVREVEQDDEQASELL